MTDMKQGWEIKRLGEVYDVRDGTHDSPKYVKEGYALITSKNLKNDNLNYDNVNYITEQDYLNINKRSKVDVGDVLFAMIGTIGNPIVIKNEPDFAIKNVALFKVPKNQDSYFLKYYLDSGIVIEQMTKDAKGATQKFVGLGYLRNFEILLPPLPEQQRIVGILDEAFAAIDKAKANAQQNLKNAKELFESYLQGVFENKGDGWEEKTLGVVYDVRDGTHDSPKYQEEGFPLITSKNLKKDLLNYDNVNYISEQDYININKRSKVDKGDILFAMIGTIGNPVVIQDEPDFAIKNVALFKIPNEQNSYFLKYYLDAKSTIDKMMGDAKGTTQKFVGLGYLRGFKILLPPLNEQQTIVQKLDALSAETKKLEAIYTQKIMDLEELKKSVLQKAFAGELKTANKVLL